MSGAHGVAGGCEEAEAHAAVNGPATGSGRAVVPEGGGLWRTVCPSGRVVCAPPIRGVASALLTAAGLLCAGDASATAAGPCETVACHEAAVNEVFDGLERAYLEGVRTPKRDSLATARTLDLIAEGFPAGMADVAAAKIYRVYWIASRLASGALIRSALSEHAEAYELTDPDPQARVNFFAARATLQLTRSDCEAGLVFLDSAIAYGHRGIDPCLLGNVHTLRGHLARCHDDLARAHEHFVEGARILVEDCGSLEFGTHRSYEGAANTAVMLGRYDEAVEYARLGLRAQRRLAEGESSAPDAYLTHLVLAQALAATGEATEAVAAARRGIALAHQRNDSTRVVTGEIGLAEVYMTLGREREAADILERLWHVGPAHFTERSQRQLFNDLGEVRRRQGDYRGLVDVLVRQHAVGDSLRAASKVWELRELHARHNRAKVNQQLAVARAELLADRAAVKGARVERIALALTVVVLALVGVLLVWRLRARSREGVRLEAMVQERTAELAAQTTQLQERTRDLHAQAVELRRSNVELERFAHIASHDLKTPVRNVTSFLGLLARRLRPEPGSDVAEYLQLARAYARQMDTIVTDVLEFSRLDTQLSAQCTRVDLRGCLERLTLKLGDELARRRATVEVVGQAEAYLPEAYFEQVARNLIDNAVRYNESPFPWVRVELSAEPGGGFVARFVDNGIGIAPEYHEQVFELFKRLHGSDEYAGTGLGLAVCRKVVERMGGSLEVESTGHDGSAFTIRLATDCRDVTREAGVGAAVA